MFGLPNMFPRHKRQQRGAFASSLVVCMGIARSRSPGAQSILFSEICQYVRLRFENRIKQTSGGAIGSLPLVMGTPQKRRRRGTGAELATAVAAVVVGSQ